MPLRISAVRVAPMKMPSSWKLQTDTIGARIIHGRYSAAVTRTVSRSVIQPMKTLPSAA